jgi:carboxyl-terminal processing protease
MRISAAPLFAAVLLSAIEPSSVIAQEPDGGYDEELGAAERAWIASRVYRAIELNFGHWDDIPDYDLQEQYREYLDRAMEAADRREFSLATQEFVAGLGNSHTYFSDRALYTDAGPPHGYQVRYVDGEWIVIRSRRPELSAGDVIVTVNGESIDAFYERNRPYLNASTERYARRRLFFSNQRHLWPESYTLGLSNGTAVLIEGPVPSSDRDRPVVDGRWLEPGRTAYIRVGSWNDQEYRDRAMELLEQYQAAEFLIVDVRENGGGSTPVAFIAALMDRPWRWYAEASPMRLAVFANAAESGRAGFSDFRRPMMSWPASVEDADSLFTGRLAILIDAGCHSACEDFSVPFKDNGRAILVGEATAGSSGQPYYETVEEGMRLAVGTKREYFPDGSKFEGIGVAPDIGILPTAADLRAGRDPELEAALAALQAPD